MLASAMIDIVIQVDIYEAYVFNLIYALQFATRSIFQT